MVLRGDIMTNGSGSDTRLDGKLLRPIWTLRRSDRHAVCYMTAHPTGQELCLTVGGNPVWRHVCRTQDELLVVQQDWRTALRYSGWKPSDVPES